MSIAVNTSRPQLSQIDTSEANLQSAPRAAATVQTWEAKPSKPAPKPEPKKPEGAQPTGKSQREAIWQRVQDTAYKTLPGGVQATPEMGEGWYDSAENTPIGMLRSRADELWEIPLAAGIGASYYSGNILVGVLAGAVGSLKIPVVAVQKAVRDVRMMLRAPRAVTAKVRWQPREDNKYAGLFKGHAPGLITLAVDHLGPVMRWQSFVDGKDPVELKSHVHWGMDAAGKLAHVNPDGTQAKGPVPEAVSLQLHDWSADEGDKDWRSQAMHNLKSGHSLYSVCITDPKTHERIEVGDLILESNFVASSWGDEHLA